MEWHRIRNLPRTQAINNLGGESAPLILVKKEQSEDLIHALSFRSKQLEDFASTKICQGRRIVCFIC